MSLAPPSTADAVQVASVAPPPAGRIDHLDATRAFALLLGIVFHASLSFMPVFIGWAVQDVSTSPVVGAFVTVSHGFRMETFFLLAGFFTHLTLSRRSLPELIRNRAVRILVPLVVGWFILRPLIVSGWVMGAASLRGDYDFGIGLTEGFRSLNSLPNGLFTGTHLWFLYYLALITTIVLLLRAAVTGITLRRLIPHADRAAAWLAISTFGLPAIAAPTAVLLWFMRNWSVDTPDHTLVPQIPVLALYGGCFLLGWMFSRQDALIEHFGRLTADRWLVAVLGTAGSLVLLGTLGLDPAHPRHAMGKVGFVVCYALMMWSLVSLTLGGFRWLCRRPRPWIRYLADSSYWLYLIHLPIVVWLQVAVAEAEVHWSLKLAFITIVTTAICLLTYDLFVRSTFIGQILNGRRHERAIRFVR